MNLKHDSTEAFEGILWASQGPWLTLREVSALKAGQPPATLPGEMVIHRENVAYTQVLP